MYYWVKKPSILTYVLLLLQLLLLLFDFTAIAQRAELCIDRLYNCRIGGAA